MTPAQTASANSSASGIEFEPPLACIRRLLKNSLPKSTNVGKDASTAFARACGIFVIYLTTCANDFARENRRQTITANDVLAAMKELDFDEFTPQLEAFLEQHRADERSKKDAKAKAAAAKQAEAEEQTSQKSSQEDDSQHQDEIASPGEAAEKATEPDDDRMDDDEEGENENNDGDARSEDMEE